MGVVCFEGGICHVKIIQTFARNGGGFFIDGMKEFSQENA